EVELVVRLNAARRHPLPPFRRTGGFSASAVLSRSEFGIDAWPLMIGDRVELWIEAEATRSRTAAREATPDDADSQPPVAETGSQNDALEELRAAADADAGITTDTAARAAPAPDPPPPPAEPP